MKILGIKKENRTKPPESLPAVFSCSLLLMFYKSSTFIPASELPDLSPFTSFTALSMISASISLDSSVDKLVMVICTCPMVFFTSFWSGLHRHSIFICNQLLLSLYNPANYYLFSCSKLFRWFYIMEIYPHNLNNRYG